MTSTRARFPISDKRDADFKSRRVCLHLLIPILHQPRLHDQRTSAEQSFNSLARLRCTGVEAIIMASKVHQFVKTRNDLDDLMIPPPAVSNGQKAQQQKNATHGSRRQSAPKQQQEQNFYDTDASNADKSSATVSVARANNGHGEPLQLDTRHAAHVVSSDASDGSDGSAEQEEEEASSNVDLPEDVFAITQTPKGNGQLSHRQLKKMRETDEARRMQKIDGGQFPYMKGDSYPSTTSGQLSVSDEGNRAQLQPARQTQKASMPPPPQTGRQSTMRVPVGQQSVQNTASVHQTLPTKHREHPAKKQDQTLPVHPSVPPRAHAPAAQPPVAQHTLPTDAIQRAARPAPKPDSMSAHQVAYKTSILPPDDFAAPQAHRKAPKAQHDKTAPTAVQQQIIKTAPEPEPLSMDAPEDEQDFQNGRVAQDDQHEEPQKLDYEPPALFDMQYHTLKDANFDVDPNADHFNMPDDQPANTLAEKLASMSRFQAEDQAKFMATLDIEQWEEAGEWFLGRFGQLASRYKDARRDKRKAAGLFEAEIEKRHGAVSKKRTLTESALSEMKASGAQVLQVTPKRAKKTN